MAKKYEFKPDRTGTSDLGKLYITKKQRKTVLRWSLFALCCLVLLIFQDVLMSHVRIMGATTDLVASAILMICLLCGAESGGVFTLAASFVWVFSGSAPGIYSAVLLTAFGIFLSVFRQMYLRKGWGSTLFCTGLALLGYEMAVFIIGLLLGLTRPDRLGSFLMTVLLTGLTMPLMYPVLSAVSKIGGETWKE